MILKVPSNLNHSMIISYNFVIKVESPSSFSVLYKNKISFMYLKKVCHDRLELNTE